MSKQLSIRDRIAFFAKIETERAEKQGGQWNKGVSIVKDEDLPKSVSAPQIKTTPVTSAPFKKVIKLNEDPAAAPKQTEPTPAPKSVQNSGPTQNSNTTTSNETSQNSSNAPRVFTRKINIESPTITTQSATKVSISDADVDRLIDQVLEKQKENKTDDDSISITYKAPSLVTLKLNTGNGPASDPNPPVSVPMTTLLPNTAAQNNNSTPIISKSVVSVAVPVVNSGPARVLGHGKQPSLQDVQQAIKKTQLQKAESQIQREQRQKFINVPADQPRTGRRMSKAERKEFRQTRRNTVIDQKSQVESRINEFIKTLHTFERLLDKEREETRAVVGRLELVTGLLALANTEMDSLKINIDKLVEEHKRSSNKDPDFSTSLTTFQDQFWKFRHNFDVQVAKSTKELRSQDGELLARSSTVISPSQTQSLNNPNTNTIHNNTNTANVPNAPPAPTFKSIDQKTGKLSVTPFSAFLEQIQKGVALKKTEYENTRKEKEESMKRSLNVADSLGLLLKEALDSRQMYLEAVSSSDEEEREADW
jgi:hypothetical protein